MIVQRPEIFPMNMQLEQRYKYKNKDINIIWFRHWILQITIIIINRLCNIEHICSPAFIGQPLKVYKIRLCQMLLSIHFWSPFPVKHQQMLLNMKISYSTPVFFIKESLCNVENGLDCWRHMKIMGCFHPHGCCILDGNYIIRLS